jgi:hypothetical protein
MIIRNPQRLTSALIVALALVPALAAQAQSVSGGAYSVRKFVIAGGGGEPQGAMYRAAVTIGQSAVQVSNGGGYRLVSGFHPAKAPGGNSDALFCSSFENTPCISGANP